MNIAVLTSSFPRFRGDGTAPFIKSIAEGYVKLGHNVQIVAPYDPLVTQTDSNDQLKIVWFKYFWPKSFNLIGHGRSLKGDAKLSGLSILLIPFYILFGIITLLRICRKIRIDVIHVNWVLPNGPIALIVSKLLHIPYFVSLHGSDIYVSKGNLLFSKIALMIFRSACYITACSENLKDEAIRLGASEERIKVIPWGADPEIFNPENYSVEYREKNGVSPDMVLVAAAGRLVYKKGFDVLLSAWESISESFPMARLIIGGDGPLKGKLIAQIKDLGIEKSVLFVGEINWLEMRVFLASADIFVLPSKRDEYGNIDGLPTILLEAMSSGNACIASDIGGVSLVIKNWENGLLVQEKSVDDLLHALKILVSDPQIRFRLNQEARKSVEMSFTWEKVSDNLLSLFKLAQGNRAREDS